MACVSEGWWRKGVRVYVDGVAWVGVFEGAGDQCRRGGRGVTTAGHANLGAFDVELGEVSSNLVRYFSWSESGLPEECLLARGCGLRETGYGAGIRRRGCRSVYCMCTRLELSVSAGGEMELVRHIPAMSHVACPPLNVGPSSRQLSIYNLGFRSYAPISRILNHGPLPS